MSTSGRRGQMSSQDREKEIEERKNEARQRNEAYSNETNGDRETRKRDNRNATTIRPVTARRGSVLYDIMSPEEKLVADANNEARRKLQEQEAKSEAETKKKQKDDALRRSLKEIAEGDDFKNKNPIPTPPNKSPDPVPVVQESTKIDPFRQVDSGHVRRHGFIPDIFDSAETRTSQLNDDSSTKRTPPQEQSNTRWADPVSQIPSQRPTKKSLELVTDTTSEDSQGNISSEGSASSRQKSTTRPKSGSRTKSTPQVAPVKRSAWTPESDIKQEAKQQTTGAIDTVAAAGDGSAGDTSGSNGRPSSTASNSSTESERETAAVKINKFGRGLLDRRKVRKLREQKTTAAAATAAATAATAAAASDTAAANTGADTNERKKSILARRKQLAVKLKNESKENQLDRQRKIKHNQDVVIGPAVAAAAAATARDAAAAAAAAARDAVAAAGGGSAGDTSGSNGRPSSTASNSSTESERETAAVKINKFGRGIVGRQKVRKLREQKTTAAAAAAARAGAVGTNPTKSDIENLAGIIFEAAKKKKNPPEVLEIETALEEYGIPDQTGITALLSGTPVTLETLKRAFVTNRIDDIPVHGPLKPDTQVSKDGGKQKRGTKTPRSSPFGVKKKSRLAGLRFSWPSGKSNPGSTSVTDDSEAEGKVKPKSESLFARFRARMPGNGSTSTPSGDSTPVSATEGSNNTSVIGSRPSSSGSNDSIQSDGATAMQRIGRGFLAKKRVKNLRKEAAEAKAVAREIFNACRATDNKIKREDAKSQLQGLEYSDIHIEAILAQLPLEISLKELENSLSQNTAERNKPAQVLQAPAAGAAGGHTHTGRPGGTSKPDRGDSLAFTTADTLFDLCVKKDNKIQKEDLKVQLQSQQSEINVKAILKDLPREISLEQLENSFSKYFAKRNAAAEKKEAGRLELKLPNHEPSSDASNYPTHSKGSFLDKFRGKIPSIFSRKPTDASHGNSHVDGTVQPKRGSWFTGMSEKKNNSSTPSSSGHSSPELQELNEKHEITEQRVHQNLQRPKNKPWFRSSKKHDTTSDSEHEKRSPREIRPAYSRRKRKEHDEMDETMRGEGREEIHPRQSRTKHNITNTENQPRRTREDTDSDTEDSSRQTNPRNRRLKHARSSSDNKKWQQYYDGKKRGYYYVLGNQTKQDKQPEWKKDVDWEVGKPEEEIPNDNETEDEGNTDDEDDGSRDNPSQEQYSQQYDNDEEDPPAQRTRQLPDPWNLNMPTYLTPRETPKEIEVPSEELQFNSYKGARLSLCYIIWSVTLFILCFMGMTGWNNVEPGSNMFRRDYLSCVQQPCPLNKTHQSVHAFASDYMSMSQSISFQSPFMQTHVMNSDSISKMLPTWMSNGNTVYDVIDLCVLKERHLEAPDNKTMITCTQTENFCPIVTTGQAETCENWLERIKTQTSSDTWPANVPDQTSLCKQYAATYASSPYRAQLICKMMRSPRMSLAHVQNNNYNLFSTHNEMYLSGCLNVIIAVFSCAIALSVLRQVILGKTDLDYFAYSDVEKKPGLRTIDGLFSLLMIGQAFIIVTVYFGLLAKTTTENHNYVKSMLLPTGSIIITAMSGAVAVLLVACSPFYRVGSVEADKAVLFTDLEDNQQPEKYTTLSMNRYDRFLLTRNDLCLAYCNFVTFPILVLLVYVKYQWYSIDVHIQRAFFSAVAVGALNIVEVSVMGVMFLITEMDSSRTRTEYANIWLFAHSNLINFTVQFVFVMSKMAIFIPTILEIKQNIRWTDSNDLTDQFNGQKNGTQSLVAVMISSFVVNHVLYIVWNVISNLGFNNKVLAVMPESIDTNMCTFLLMNTIVIVVLNYAQQ